MRVRKRQILLIIIGLLPLHKFIHLNDYCFGDEDLVIIFGYSTLFFIVFIVILFNNLYGMNIKRELFNKTPLIIGGVYFISLLFCLKYHDANLLKKQKSVFSINETSTQVFLFEDQTFEIKTTKVKLNCYYRGKYLIKKDSLFLKFNRNTRTTAKFNTDYQIIKDKIVFSNKKTR